MLCFRFGWPDFERIAVAGAALYLGYQIMTISLIKTAYTTLAAIDCCTSCCSEFCSACCKCFCKSYCEWSIQYWKCECKSIWICICIWRPLFHFPCRDQLPISGGIHQSAALHPTSYPGSLLGARQLAGGKTLVQAGHVIC